MRSSYLDPASKMALVQNTALFGHWKSLSSARCNAKTDLRCVSRWCTSLCILQTSNLQPQIAAWCCACLGTHPPTTKRLWNRDEADHVIGMPGKTPILSHYFSSLLSTSLLQLFVKMSGEEFGLIGEALNLDHHFVEAVLAEGFFPFGNRIYFANPLFSASLLSLFLFSSRSLLRISILAEAMYTTACCYAPASLEAVFEQLGEKLGKGSILTS